MTPRTTWLLPAAFAAVSAAGLVLATHEDADAKVDPRTYDLKRGKAKLFGRTVADWTVAYWQWNLSLPAAVNPQFDTTGELVEVGQRGPVWFLAGVYSTSGTADRTATIPAGKALFFSVLNIEWDNVGLSAPNLLTADQMRGKAAEAVNLIDLATLRCEVDGTAIAGLQRNRVASAPFTFWMPDANAQQAAGLDGPKGIWNPCVTDGYWVFLKPLRVGEHTIHFAGTYKAPISFSLDVTYRLTVVDHTLP